MIFKSNFLMVVYISIVVYLFPFAMFWFMLEQEVATMLLALLDEGICWNTVVASRSDWAQGVQPPASLCF